MDNRGPTVCSKLHSILLYIEKAIGFAWVLGFLTFVTPWLIYPSLRVGGELALPYGFVELLGMHNVLNGVIVGAFFIISGVRSTVLKSVVRSSSSCHTCLVKLKICNNF
jgi:hypothetical protein